MDFRYTKSCVDKRQISEEQLVRRRGRPKRKFSDQLRVRVWYAHIAHRLDRSERPYGLEREAAHAVGRDIRKSRHSNFYKYRDGKHVPKDGLIEVMERLHPGTALWLRHPFWAAVEPSTSVAELTEINLDLPAPLRYWALDPDLNFESLAMTMSLLQQVASLDALTAVIRLTRLREWDPDHRVLLRLYGTSMRMLLRFLVQPPLQTLSDDVLSFVASSLLARGIFPIEALLPDLATELRGRLQRNQVWATIHSQCWPNRSLQEQRTHLYWMESLDPALLEAAVETGHHGESARLSIVERVHRLMGIDPTP